MERLVSENDAEISCSGAEMSIKSEIFTQVGRIGGEMKRNLPPLTDDLLLADSGLDSLAIAVLVARLEDTLGLDPFNDSEAGPYPVTLGDLVRFYEQAAAG